MFENNAMIDEVIITNSIDHSHLSNFKKLRELSLAQFLSMVINANIESKSITEVYNAYGKRKQ